MRLGSVRLRTRNGMRGLGDDTTVATVPAPVVGYNGQLATDVQSGLTFGSTAPANAYVQSLAADPVAAVYGADTPLSPSQVQYINSVLAGVGLPPMSPGQYTLLSGSNVGGSAPTNTIPSGGGAYAYPDTNIPASAYTPASAYSAVPSSVPVIAQGQGLPLSAKIVNASRPNQPFQVGDQFSVVLTGPPNAVVTNSASQNGTSLGTGSYGTTDQNGNATVNGTLDASTVGNWVEDWYVAGQKAGTISFSVKAAPTSTPAPSGAGAGSGSGSGSGSSSGSGSGSSTSSSSTSTTTTSDSSTSDLFSSIPAWGWIAIAAGAAFLLMGKK